MRTISLTAKIIQKLCFAAGTLVVMADGTLKPIEQIEAGEMVQCDYDPELDNGPEVSVVTRTFRNNAPEVLDLCIESNGDAFTLTTTPEHPFWSTHAQGFVVAADLRVGARLGDGRTLAKLLNTTERPGQCTVHNLEVAGAHTYYVVPPTGKEPILVHNACVRPGSAAWRRLANSSSGRAKGLTTHQIRDRFHRIKRAYGIGPDANTRVDDAFGDVYDWREQSESYGQVVGNIFNDF